MVWAPWPTSFRLDVIASVRSTILYVFAYSSRACPQLTSNSKQSGAYTGHDGSAVVIKNVICIHEEDAGLLWKHTDYRVGGRSHSVRARRLVVSMVCTLANYGRFYFAISSIIFVSRTHMPLSF